MLVPEDPGGSGEGIVIIRSKDELVGYVACPITSLGEKDEIIASRVSNQVAGIAYDRCSIKKYQPIKETNPRVGKGKDLSPSDVYWVDRSRIAEADVVFEILDYPSCGVGGEDQLALSCSVPVIRIFKTGCILSKFILGSPAWCISEIQYESEDDLTIKLYSVLLANLSGLRKYRNRKRRIPDTGFSAGFRALFAARKSSERELAQEIGVSQEFIDRLLNAPEGQSNPSLTHLKMLADACGLSFPEMMARLFPVQTDDSHLLQRNRRSCEAFARNEDIPYSLFEDLWKEYEVEFLEDEQQVSADDAFGVVRRDVRDLSHIDWMKRLENLQKSNEGGGEQGGLFGDESLEG